MPYDTVLMTFGRRGNSRLMRKVKSYPYAIFLFFMMRALLKNKLFGKKRYRNGVALNVLELQEFSTKYMAQSKLNNVRSSQQACKNTLYKHQLYKSSVRIYSSILEILQTAIQCHVLRQWFPLKVRRSRFNFPSRITKTAARSQIRDSILLPAPGRIKGLPVGQVTCTG